VHREAHAGCGRGPAGNDQWRHRRRARGPTSPTMLFRPVLGGIVVRCSGDSELVTLAVAQVLLRYDGMPVMWCLANPKIGEREVLAALVDQNHHLIRHGQVLLADKSLSGKDFKKLTEAMGVRPLRPDAKDRSTSNNTAAAPPLECSPAPHNAYWPWQQASGTTGPPA
jgi:hypothetical protein